MQLMGERVVSLESTVVKLEDDKKQLIEAVAQQQRFLESVDQEKRLANLIIMGVNETAALIPPGNAPPGRSSAVSDHDKVQLILETIGGDSATAHVSSVQRLGKSTDKSTRPRPLKVTLQRAEDRKQILQSTKTLKEAGENYAHIFVKKDVHPGIRREVNRLKWEAKKEAEKPENAGKVVMYDWNDRTVKVDGLVTDKYQPHFF